MCGLKFRASPALTHRVSPTMFGLLWQSQLSLTIHLPEFKIFVQFPRVCSNPRQASHRTSAESVEQSAAYDTRFKTNFLKVFFSRFLSTSYKSVSAAVSAADHSLCSMSRKEVEEAD